LSESTFYVNNYFASHLPNVTAPLAAERAIEITASLIDLARVEMDINNFPEYHTRPKTKHRPTICFDEWNVWDPERAPGDKGAEQDYNLSDALAVAIWLNVFIRQARYIGMATIAQSVNVISPLMTTESKVIKQATYWPLFLFSKYMRGQTLAVNLCCGKYVGKTNPEWLATTSDMPWLDVSAALNDGFVNLAVVNISEDTDIECEIPITSTVQVFTVGANNASVRDHNMEGEDKVVIEETSFEGRGTYKFAKHSLTLLRWKS